MGTAKHPARFDIPFGDPTGMCRGRAEPAGSENADTRNTAMDLETFTSHLMALRQAGRWGDVARLVSDGLDAAPVGSAIMTTGLQQGSTVRLIKLPGGGLDWHREASWSRELRAGPRRGQIVPETSVSLGGAWGEGVSAGLGPEPRPEFIAFVWTSLRNTGRLPAPAAREPGHHEPLAIGHKSGPPLQDQ